MILILILCHPTFSAKQKAKIGTRQIPESWNIPFLPFAIRGRGGQASFLLPHGPTLQRFNASLNRHPILTLA